MVLHPRIPAPDWSKGRCAGMITSPDDEDPFFDDEEAAVEFCNTLTPKPCPIREQCLVFSLINNCSTGVWGGMGELDRKALRKRWPLGRSKGPEGWQPRPEWEWFAPGEASAGLDQELLRRELEEELSSDPV